MNLDFYEAFNQQNQTLKLTVYLVGSSQQRSLLVVDGLERACVQGFYLQIVTKIFFLSCPRLCDRGLVVAILYCFEMWNKKEHQIINFGVSSSHIDPMYIETPNIYMYKEKLCDFWSVLNVEVPIVQLLILTKMSIF